jgi:hypothetical protein
MKPCLREFQASFGSGDEDRTHGYHMLPKPMAVSTSFRGIPYKRIPEGLTHPTRGRILFSRSFLRP